METTLNLFNIKRWELFIIEWMEEANQSFYKRRSICSGSVYRP
jgi:hypothetical protein